MEKHAFVSIDGFDYTLTQLEDNLWRRLLNGALRSKDAFRTGAIATIGPEGPAIRTVVLRKVLPAAKILICHTDLRSEKVRHIERNPVIGWHFYDPAARLQLRLRATATLLTEGPDVETAWRNTHVESRKCYLSTDGPGAVLPYPGTGLENEWENPSIEASEAGKAYFCILQSQIAEVEWLWLNQAGHRRARFRYDAEGQIVEACWLVP